MTQSWVGVPVLVTGAGGFIASHLVEALVAAGARVTALCHYNSRHDEGNLRLLAPAVRDQVEVVFGDIRDGAQLRRMVAAHRRVFHLAALVGIPYSYHAPQSYVETNVQGTLNLVQAALDNGVERVVHVSTSEVYGSARYVPIDEHHPLQPQSPYSASKIAAESLALSFHHAFDLPVVIARPFNAYGPRQSLRAVIPSILAQLAQRVEVLRIGSTAPRRDFTFVGDTARGLLNLGAAAGVIGQVVNLGSGTEVSIAELIDLCCELVGYRPQIEVEQQRERPPSSEVLRLLCDNARARQLLEWHPQVELRAGLLATLRFVEQQPPTASAGRYIV